MSSERRPNVGAGLGATTLTALLLAAFAVAALSTGSPPSPDEAAARLAAESLARDGDLVLTVEDESRMRLRGWPETIRPPMVIDGGGVVRFAGPWFYAVLLAPFELVAGHFGALFLNSLLLLVTVLVSIRSLGSRSGESAVWTVVACVFGSALVAYLGAGLPVMMLVAATALAMALFSTEAGEASVDLPHMYREEIRRRPLIGRFLLGGLLIGIVAAHHPLYLLLLLVPVALTPRKNWITGIPATLIGAALVLAVAWFVSGLWVDQPFMPSDVERVEVSVGAGPTGVEKSDVSEMAAQPWMLSFRAPTLVLWNAVYASIGKHVGLLPYFLPLVFLVGVWKPDFGRGALLLVAALAVVGSFLLAPFSFAGLPSAIGNRLFVPFYVMLWWLPARSLGKSGAAALLIAGAAVLWPLWIPGASPLSEVQSGDFPRGPLLDLLPSETTLRDIPVRGEIVTRDLLVRPQANLETAGRSGHFILPTGGEARLLVASPRAVRSLEVVFDSAAVPKLEIAGGEVGNMTLTAAGGVTFEVRLGDSPVRHPVWWSAEEHSFHRLRLEMPDARRATVFSIAGGR